MNDFRIRVSGILVEEDKVLLLEQETSSRKYAIPGGGVESNETLEQAIIREFREEIGLTIKPEKILYISEYYNAEGTHVVEVVFAVTRVDMTEGMVVGYEPNSLDHIITGYAMVPLDKLDEIGMGRISSVLTKPISYGQYKGLREK